MTGKIGGVAARNDLKPKYLIFGRKSFIQHQHSKCLHMLRMSSIEMGEHLMIFLSAGWRRWFNLQWTGRSSAQLQIDAHNCKMDRFYILSVHFLTPKQTNMQDITRFSPWVVEGEIVPVLWVGLICSAPAFATKYTLPQSQHNVRFEMETKLH